MCLVNVYKMSYTLYVNILYMYVHVYTCNYVITHISVFEVKFYLHVHVYTLYMYMTMYIHCTCTCTCVACVIYILFT